MANVVVRGVVSILAAAASLSPCLACGQFESWLTDEEIAIAKAGGDVPFRGYHYVTMSPLPDIEFAFPLIGEGATELNAIADARSQVLASVDQPFEVASSATVPVEDVAPVDEHALPAPADERSGMKKVIIACSGEVLISPNAL